MSQFLTSIESIYQERVKNYRLIFGKPVHTDILYRRESEAKQIDYFEPNSLFCLDLWEGGKYGTKNWRVVIARTIAPGELGVNIVQVTPNIKLLFDIKGQPRAQAALKWVKAMQDKYENLTTIKDEVFEIAGLRLKAMTTIQLKDYINSKTPRIDL